MRMARNRDAFLEPLAVGRQVGDPFEQALDVRILDARVRYRQAGGPIGKLARELGRFGTQIEELLVIEIDDPRVHATPLHAAYLRPTQIEIELRFH
jgi:hypothetical protein